MTEDRVPYIAEGAPPPVSMFERLVSALQANVDQQCGDGDAQQRLRHMFNSEPVIFIFREDGDGADFVSVPVLIRALLTELRNHDDADVVLAAARAHPADAFRAGIDAILAQGGGSGG